MEIRSGLYSFENANLSVGDFDSIIGSLRLTEKTGIKAGSGAINTDDLIKLNGMREVESSLQIYRDGHNGKYPNSLELLLKDFPHLESTLKENTFLYAYSRDYKKFHLGILLSTNTDSKLDRDGDFNSIAVGYINGFNGKDPIYDIVGQ